MKSVSIFGAGISGLTIAHELSEKGFEVFVYEKDENIGGMAKSKRNKNNLPTEHSWRGYASFYHNTFNILKRIPIKSICETFTNEKFYDIDEVQKHTKEDDLWTYYKGNVYDLTNWVKKHPGGRIILNCGGKNLEDTWNKFNVSWHNGDKYIMKRLETYKIGKLKESYSENNYTVYDNLIQDKLKFVFLKNDRIIQLSLISKIRIFFLVLESIFSDKRKEVWKNILLKDYIKNNFDNDTYEYIINGAVGPGIGLDLNTASLYQFYYFASLDLSNWKNMNKPTSEAWFDIWKEYLQSRNVKFIRGELKKIKYDNNHIINCELTDNTIISTDEYCFAINPNDACDIFEKSSMTELYTTFENLKTVNNQISFFITLKKKVIFPEDMNSIVLVDSDFNITMYSQDNLWCNSVLQKESYKSLWSGTCCQSSSGIQLNIDEFKKQILKQIFDCKSFLSILEKKNNYLLTIDDIQDIELYDEWKYKDGRLQADNKKWVNNMYNDNFKPDSKTIYDNFYISGGHTNTSFPIWSMESSTESGKIVSNLILSKYNKELAFVYKHNDNVILNFLGKADNTLYMLGLPNIIYILLVLIMIFIIIFIIISIIQIRKRK
jgi:cytochrome b involved in lipid metabolism